MKIKDIVHEEADAITSSSGNIATVDAPLFKKPIKRNPTNKKYANSPSYDKYNITGEQNVNRRSKNIIG